MFYFIEIKTINCCFILYYDEKIIQEKQLTSIDELKLYSLKLFIIRRHNKLFDHWDKFLQKVYLRAWS
jgi:hypothetical protein